MSRMAAMVLIRHDGFPRVSGDEPSEALRDALMGMFSPRERG